MKNKVYKLIACELARIDYCKANINNGNEEHFRLNMDEAKQLLRHIEKQYLPHGSGIDCGCTINLEKSHRNNIVIDFSFHHMDDNGFYCGWTDYQCIVRPDLHFGYEIIIKGKNINSIKDYLFDLFDYELNEEKTI